MMDYELEEYALEDVPGLAVVRGQPESLDLVAAAVLDRFAEPRDIYVDEASRQFFDRTVRYVGATLVDLFGGTWDLADSGDARGGSAVVVRLPFRELPEVPSTLVTAAIARRRSWSQLLQFLHEDETKFRETGIRQ